MTKYQLLTTDMDGTLLNSDKQISKATQEAFHAARSQGKIVALSTGRALAELNDYPEALKDVQYGILESGALIYDFFNHKVIRQTTIPVDCLENIIKAARDNGAMIQALCVDGVYLQRDELDHIEDFFMDVYRPMYERVGTIVDDVTLLIEKHRAFEKINLFHPSQMARERSFECLKHLPLALVYAETTSLEISPLGISKGDGLKALCDYINVPVSVTIAVGDADNDLDILKTAGLSIAVGNANEHVKDLADIIVSDNDHDGVKEAVEHYLL